MLIGGVGLTEEGLGNIGLCAVNCDGLGIGEKERDILLAPKYVQPRRRMKLKKRGGQIDGQLITISPCEGLSS